MGSMDSDDKHSQQGSLDAQSDEVVDQLEEGEATSDKSASAAEATAELSPAGTEEDNAGDGDHPGADIDIGQEGHQQEESLEKAAENDEVEAHPREPGESNLLVPEQESSGVLEMTEIDLTDQAACKDSSISNGNFAKAEKETEEEEADVSLEPSLEDKNSDRKVSPIQICRYADKWDLLLMLLGTISAICIGAAPIINYYFYGDIVNKFVWDSIEKEKYEAQVAILANSTVTASPYVDDVFEEVTHTTMKIFYLGIAVFLGGYFAMACWIWTTERQIYRIRVRFFRSVMKQHIGWFDENNVGGITHSLTEDISNLQNGLGDTLAQSIQAVTTFLGGYVLGFVSNWKMTLVSLSLVPLIAVGYAFNGKSIKTLSEKELKAYSKAGCVAAEVFSSIKTVAAFGGENKESERYGKNLTGAYKIGMRKALATGLSTSWTWLLIHTSMALSFWYGLKLQREEDVSPGDVLRALIGVLMGSINLGQAVPYFEVIQTARVAAANVYSIIDMKSEIDSASPEGKKPKDVYGDLELQGVHFTYPMRPDAPVLNGLNLKVCAGQTVALVGSSGCGKSTIIQLLMRFYDVDQGAVVLDGHNVKDLNIKWLREHISLVSQEPVLFATTIAENIRYGQEDVTFEQIESAAREANAHDFIMKLPEKYDTMVGERGAQLSGGQKQRVAIARALLSNPRILLLDEATSALDTESEALVQQSLNKASEGRTTILIAHRLSTVQTADIIVVLDKGQVVEQGTHHELMTKKGPYYLLVQAQLQMKEDKESDTTTKDDIMEKSSRRHSVVRLSLKRKLSRKVSRLSLDGFEGDQSDDEDEENEGDVQFQPMKRLLRLSAPEWHYMVMGCVSAAFTGCFAPATAVMFSEMLGTFAEVDLKEQERATRVMAVIFFGVGVGFAIAAFFRHYVFGRIAENVTMRLRKMTFAAVIRQEMGWFDRTENQVGVLLARLAKDASNIRWVAGLQLGLTLEALAGILAALIVAFVFGWKLALVILAFMPLLVISGVVQGKMNQTRTGQKGKLDAVEEGAKIALEAWMNIRTVASLTREERFARTFEEHFDTLYQTNKKKGWIYGILFSFSQSVIMFCYAASFSFGAYLVDKGEMPFVNVFRVYSTITMAGLALGRISSIATSYKKGKISAGKIFALIDSEPAISTNGGLKPESCLGKVAFDKVSFSYPARQDVRVLNHLKLELSPGKTLALVGASGCGKSTVVQLLERFYDPSAGHLKLDGTNLQDLDLGWLRSQLGIVSQEPVLFDTSIQENIAYGDNSRQIPMEEIIEAARKANIHNFIHCLPQGYDTNVGEMGTQLSGGQKQRVAIARALLRNPRILLLDEATSALDAESEKSVQEALDKASEGRTCIIIAHRLSTIQGADTIAVIENGAIVEQGSHAQLLHKKGHYYNLQQARLEAPGDSSA